MMSKTWWRALSFRLVFLEATPPAWRWPGPPRCFRALRMASVGLGLFSGALRALCVGEGPMIRRG